MLIHAEILSPLFKEIDGSPVSIPILNILKTLNLPLNDNAVATFQDIHKKVSKTLIFKY